MKSETGLMPVVISAISLQYGKSIRTLSPSKRLVHCIYNGFLRQISLRFTNIGMNIVQDYSHDIE